MKDKRFQNKTTGFTLAEVLITLGIIGVVAAMTIPTLMVDINAKQWSTAKDVFDKKLNEAMKNMNTAQVISGHPNTLSFVNELGKHFKINKICKNDDLQSCFSDTVWWGGGTATPEEVDMTTIKQASHFGLDDWGTELIGVQFANGVTGLVAYNPKCSGDPYSNQFNGTSCISMLYDVSGDKNPNTSGKDLGNFGVINRLGGATCAFEIGGTCYSSAFMASDPYIWNGDCTDGTSTDPTDQKIMSQYGIESCYYSPDYWAGAVIACGGTNKVASMNQLAEIASYIYGTESIGAEGYFNCPDSTNCRNDEFLSSIGIQTESTLIEIWSNEHYRDSNAVIKQRNLFKNGTDDDQFGTRGSTNEYYVICVN